MNKGKKMILKNYPFIWGVILAITQAGIARAAEQPGADYPSVVSLCSGIGVTDRVLLQTGFRLIASVDVDPERTALNKQNNLDCIQDQSLGYKIITGDISRPFVQDEIHKEAHERIGFDKAIDLIYCFVAQGQNINSVGIIGATFAIASKDLTHLPKMICFEMLDRATDPIWQSALNEASYDAYIRPNYKLEENKVNFSDYGLPISSKRKYKVFTRNDYYIQVSKGERYIPVLFPNRSFSGGIKEYFENAFTQNPDIPNDWWKQENPHVDKVSLHVMAGELTDDAKKVLSHLKPDMHIVGLGCLTPKPFSNAACQTCLVCQFHQEGRSKVTRFSKRYSGEKPFGSLTTRINAWYESVHFEADRGFTLFEMAVLNGLMKIGHFNLSRINPCPSQVLATTISAVTSPEFLNQLFSNFRTFLRPHSRSQEYPKVSMDLSSLPPYLFQGIVEPSKLWLFKVRDIRQQPVLGNNFLSLEENCLQNQAWNTLRRDVQKRLDSGSLRYASGTFSELIFLIKKQNQMTGNQKIEQGVATFIGVVKSYLSVEDPVIRGKLDALLMPQIKPIVERLNTKTQQQAFSVIFSAAKFYKETLALQKTIQQFLQDNQSAPSVVAPDPAPYIAQPVVTLGNFLPSFESMISQPVNVQAPLQPMTLPPIFMLPIQSGQGGQNFAPYVMSPLVSHPNGLVLIPMGGTTMPTTGILMSRVENRNVEGENEDPTQEVWQEDVHAKRRKLNDNLPSAPKEWIVLD